MQCLVRRHAHNVQQALTMLTVILRHHAHHAGMGHSLSQVPLVALDASRVLLDSTTMIRC